MKSQHLLFLSLAINLVLAGGIIGFALSRHNAPPATTAIPSAFQASETSTAARTPGLPGRTRQVANSNSGDSPESSTPLSQSRPPSARPANVPRATSSFSSPSYASSNPAPSSNSFATSSPASTPSSASFSEANSGAIGSTASGIQSLSSAPISQQPTTPVTKAQTPSEQGNYLVSNGQVIAVESVEVQPNGESFLDLSISPDSTPKTRSADLHRRPYTYEEELFRMRWGISAYQQAQSVGRSTASGN